MVSPISTEPTAHSPPNPKPCNPRQRSSCQKPWVKPLKKVNTANQTMVICRTRTRPKRSAIRPASQPPSEDISRAAVPSQPASLLLMCQAAIRLGMTKLYTMTSMPSRAQPPKVAIRALFSFDVSWDSQKTSVAGGDAGGFEVIVPIRISFSSGMAKARPHCWRRPGTNSTAAMSVPHPT